MKGHDISIHHIYSLSRVGSNIICVLILVPTVCPTGVLALLEHSVSAGGGVLV